MSGKDKKYTILSVDDEVSISEILRDILEDHYKVLTATSGEEALLLVKKEAVDLILLDVNMPGMSGFDLCKILKADPILKTIPVVFVTAYHNAQEIKKGYRLGANDYMGKPFIREEVFAKVGVHLKFGELSKIESLAKIFEEEVEQNESGKTQSLAELASEEDNELCDVEDIQKKKAS